MKMWRQPHAWRCYGIAVCVLLAAAFCGADAQSNSTANTTDTCPNAKWKALPFIANPTPPDQLTSLIKNFQMDALTNFLKQDLVPKIGANAFFFALAAVFLLFFVLWRMLRWCCVMVCCSERCDHKRSRRDAFMVLFGRNMTITKVLMGLFGLISMIFAFYGMGTVNKDVTLQAWDVIGQLGTYAGNVSGKVDNLLYTIGNVSTAIDDFQNIVKVTIDVPGFRKNLTAIQTFLNSIPSTSQLATDVAALNTALTTSLPGFIGALSTENTTFGTTKTQMDAWLTTLQGGPTVFSTITTTSSDVRTKANTLASRGSQPTQNDADIVNLQTSINPTPAISTYPTNLDALTAAINGLGALQTPAANNPFTKLKTALDNVITTANQITSTQVPSLSTRLTNMNTLYNTASPSFNWTLTQLAFVNSSVLALTGTMSDAYTKLNSATRQMNVFFGGNPTPAGLATQMTNGANGLSVPASANTLSTNLATAATNWVSAPTNAFSTTPATDYKAYISSVKTAVNTMLAQVNVVNPQLTTWRAGTNTNWATLQSASNTLSTNANSVGTAAAAGNTGGTQPSNFQTIANNYKPVLAAISTTAAGSLATSMTNGLAGMPSLASTVTNSASMDTQVSAMGNPPSAVVIGPLNALNDMWTAAVTNGDSAKTQITTIVSSFKGSTSMIKDGVVGTLQNAQANYAPLTTQYDGYRYSGSVALYAVSVVMVVLLFACAMVNYHFGITFVTLLLLVITVLYLLLALVVALVVVVLGDVCPATETIVLSFVPSNMLGVVNYAFYGTGGSVKAVLKSANILDVDVMLNQTLSSQKSVMSSMTGSYTFRPGPNAVIGRFNSTVDGVVTGVNGILDMASYETLNPIYGAVKGFICCTIADTFGNTWVALTFAGIFALFLVFVTWFLIGKIDSVPRVDCCGCSLHTKSRYAPIMPALNGAIVATNGIADAGVVQVYVSRPGEGNGKVVQVALPPV